MIIEASQLLYATAHRSASATAVIDETRALRRNPHIPAPPPAGDTVQLSGIGGGDTQSGSDDLSDLDPKQRLAALVLQYLLGQKIRFMRASHGAPAAASNASPGTPAARRTIEFHSEMEQTSFQAQGVVQTADGRRIEFSAALYMHREFQSASVTTSAPQTADPLVVNFGGAPASVTGAKIAFDLNSDGKLENVSFVAGGSGLLALDSNGDGQVNDGRELFGPQTGNGFAELASYDSDGNGWIDEADPIFSKLRIWTQDGLSTLADKGIGAISTAAAETPFALKDAANVLQANIRATGVYLSESGAAGTVQQVDLAEG